MVEAQGLKPTPLTRGQRLSLLLALSLVAFVVALPALRRGRSLESSVVLQPACMLVPPGPKPPPPAKDRLRTDWKRALTREELLRGMSYYGSGARLHVLAQKLLSGRPIRVATLGGSVTTGGGASNPNLNYVNLLFKFLNDSFPHSDHVFENKAISASTAFLYSGCLEHHVPQDVDLVTLEFTINESSEAPFRSPERRSYEQVLRRLLAYPNRPAVLMMHHYAWWEAPGDGLDRGLFYHQPEGQLTTLAHYYDVPALSIRAATWHLQNAGVDRFRVDKVLLPDRYHKYIADNGTKWVGTIPQAPVPRNGFLFFLVDGMHPGDTGHAAMAELLASAVSRAVVEVESGLAISKADLRTHRALEDYVPPPMIPDSPDETPTLCAMLEDFKPVVTRVMGFEYLPERPNATDFVRQKWGWRGTQPGAWAELTLDTDTRSDKGDTLVWLSHLRSYEGMGTALIECKDGCICEPTLLDGTWDRRASLFWMTRLLVSRHKRCLMRVTIQEQPGEFPGDGHKVTLVAVMVTHVPLATAGTLANVAQMQEEFEPRKLKLQR